MPLLYVAHPLQKCERPKILYEYYVTGRGAFPFDMLRFDSCWPATGEDAQKMLDGNDVFANLGQTVSIKMHSYKEPTTDRWSSFVWSVGREKL